MNNGPPSEMPLSAEHQRREQGEVSSKTVEILVVEDDAELARQTQEVLIQAGFNVRHTETLSNAVSEIRNVPPDLLILDRMLPDGDAIDLLRELRNGDLEVCGEVPILILSALGETQDRIQGFDYGADDYLPKPFDVYELVARVSALLRRAAGSNQKQVFTVGELELNVVTRQVAYDDEEIVLQPREFKLLEYLIRNAGEVVTKAMLLKNVWGLEFDPQTNVVEVHISRLRAKLDRGRDKKLLHTVRGNGYSLHC